MTRHLTAQLVAAVMLVLMLLGPARPAAAQGTFGSLPDPITSRDLERYGERLGLSEQQLLAIAEHHGRYLEEFRELRDRDIQRFLDDVQVLTRDFDFSQRREVEQLIRTLNRLMQQIQSLDERLFAELEILLTEEQAVKLPRVRLERERSRFSGEMTRGIDFLNPAVRVDLSAIVQGMDLSPDVLEAIDPILESYERRLTQGARKLFNTTVNMVLDTLKRLEEMGFTEGTPADPRMALRLFEAFQEIWGEVSADVLADASDVAALQRSTYRTLAGLLPAEATRELRTQYYRRAYPEAVMVGRAAQRQFDAALLLEELTERQREDIEAMALSHWQSQNRIADQIIDVLDARRRDMSIREIIRRNEDERQQRIDDLRSRADAADEAALDSLHAVLGEQLAEQVRSGRLARGGAPAARVQASQVQTPADAESADPFIGRVPGRISTAQVRRYAGQLDLDEGQRIVLESLHEDYLDRYRDLSDQHFEPLRAASRELSAMGTGIADVSPRDAQRAEEIFALQRSAFEAVRDLDEAFFDDIAAIVNPEQSPALQRVRLERERLGYTGGTHRPRNPDWGGGARFARGQMNEANIDLSRLIDELQLHASIGSGAAAALIEYERKATELFRDKYEAELRMYQALRTINAQEDRRRFREVMGGAGRVSAEANRALTALNRETLAELRSALPDDAAHYLQHYYRRHAFPEVFDDPDHAAQRISDAIELSELSDSQRARLRELSLEYRSRYAEVADRMFNIHESVVQLQTEERIDRQQRVELHNELERLRFERNEINDDARRRLRAILSDAQLQRIGGM